MLTIHPVSRAATDVIVRRTFDDHPGQGCLTLADGSNMHGDAADFDALAAAARLMAEEIRAADARRADQALAELDAA